jgi:hypothetical protein
MSSVSVLLCLASYASPVGEGFEAVTETRGDVWIGGYIARASRQQARCIKMSRASIKDVGLRSALTALDGRAGSALYGLGAGQVSGRDQATTPAAMRPAWRQPEQPVRY